MREGGTLTPRISRGQDRVQINPVMTGVDQPSEEGKTSMRKTNLKAEEMNAKGITGIKITRM